MRGSVRLTVADVRLLRKVPHHLGTQPYASMGGESHGNGTETTRPAHSHDAAEPFGARSAERRELTR